MTHDNVSQAATATNSRRISRTLAAGSIAALLAAALVGPAAVVAQDEAEAAAPPAPLQKLDFKPFNKDFKQLTDKRLATLDKLVLEASIADLQAAMDAGKLSSEQLTLYYLARNKEHRDLNSMLELNPAALNQARKSDERRAAGNLRGPLDGIPVTLKGNIGSGDKMATSAGASALADLYLDRDSTVVAKLREAGAVLLGKANLSEFAGWIYPGVETAGYSSLGGFPVNPYDTALPVWGSSSGSGVGTGANLTAVSVGTETSGSLIAPSSAAMTVGMKPSLGVVSRDLVVPLTSKTDTPGPIGRSVTDVATLLTTISGVDENDVAATDAAALDGTDFTTFLDPEALDGARIGVHVGIDDPGIPVEQYPDLYGELQLSDAIAGLEAAGATVFPVFAPVPDLTPFNDIISNGFRLEYEDFIATVDPDSPFQTLADIDAWNQEDLENRAPAGPGALGVAVATTMTQEEYDELFDELRTDARAYIDGIFAANDLDALATKANQFSMNYAVAGYPAITVPDGPVDVFSGLTLVGPYLSDGELIGYAYAFEQATMARTAPPID